MSFNKKNKILKVSAIVVISVFILLVYLFLIRKEANSGEGVNYVYKLVSKNYNDSDYYEQIVTINGFDQSKHIYIERVNKLSVTDNYESKINIREYNIWINQEIGDVKLKIDASVNELSDSYLSKVSPEDIYTLVNGEKYRGDHLDYPLKRGEVENIKLRSYISLLKWKKNTLKIPFYISIGFLLKNSKN